MRWPFVVAVVCASTVTCARALASEGDSAAIHAAPGHGPTVAVSALASQPIGSAWNGSSALSSTIAMVYPLRLDAGYRLLGSHLYVGGRAEYGLLVPRGCPAGGSCSGDDVRLGVLVAFHALPARVLDPWLGAGFGWERLSVTRSLGSARTDLAASGPELGRVELGLDVRPARWLRVGPIASASLARYTTVTLNGTETTDFSTLLHGWMQAGMRASIDF